MLQSTMIAGVALVAASVATTGELVTLMSGADRVARDAVSADSVPQVALIASGTAHPNAFCEIDALSASLADLCAPERRAAVR